MIDNDTIESYLIQMDLPSEELREGMWKVDSEQDAIPPLILTHEPPIVHVRMKVFDLPAGHREQLFGRLLALNASGIAFGAFAIENDAVVLIDTLRSENLEMSELQGSIESLIVAAQEHYHELQSLLKGEE